MVYDVKYYPVFPTVLGVAELLGGVTSEELLTCERQQRGPNMKNEISMSTDILDLPELKRIRDFFMKKVQGYYKDVLGASPSVHPFITSSWLNYKNGREGFKKHYHVNSLVSGVFYLQTNPDDAIIFDRPGTPLFKLGNEGVHTYTHEETVVDARQGRLVLFPSHLRHGVLDVDGEKERISLAFNTFFRGNIGDVSGLDKLTL